MQITGTHFNYFLVCRRKMWLFDRGIQMEQNSDLVSEGRLIHETSYPNRSERFQEIELGGIKIDYFDPGNKVIHEIKKSDKKEEAHIWQLKYYIYIMRQAGIYCTGVVEYPAMRRKKEIELDVVDEQKIETQLIEIENTLSDDNCPQKMPRSKCRRCAYFDFCWVGEEED